MLDLMMILKVWLACGLATFIQGTWIFRKEIGECFKDNFTIATLTSIWVCLKCLVYWPYIQYLNYFGDEEEDK